MAEEKTAKPTEKAPDKKASKNGRVKKYLLPGVLLVLIILAGLYMFKVLSDTKDQLAEAEQKVETLNAELKQLQEAEADTEEDAEEETEPEESQEMVVAFVPGGLFDDAEKTALREKLINPYEDYQREMQDSNPLTMQIEEDENAGYSYSVSVILEDGKYQGFLYGEEDPLEWWKPTCMGECEFSDEYSEKYPEVVE